MRKRWIAHYQLRSGKRALLRSFLVAFGVLWLAFEPLGLFFPNELDWGWQGYILLVGLATVAAVWTSRPRSHIQRSLPPSDVEIEIRVGDLLEQSGNVVIGASDTFDTELEGGVISSASIQGQLLSQVFRGDRTLLDRLIAESLPGNGVEDDGKVFGKRGRYPIGTVAVVQRGDTRYFLSAFTHMSSDRPPRVASSVEDLYVALARTWQAVDDGGHREPVHVPVVGSNLGRLGLTRTLLIQMIVLSFIASSRRGGPPRLTVWVHESDQDQVDLEMLDGWLRSLCAA